MLTGLDAGLIRIYRASGRDLRQLFIFTGFRLMNLEWPDYTLFGQKSLQEKSASRLAIIGVPYALSYAFLNGPFVDDDSVRQTDSTFPAGPTQHIPHWAAIPAAAHPPPSSAPSLRYFATEHTCAAYLTTCTRGITRPSCTLKVTCPTKRRSGMHNDGNLCSKPRYKTSVCSL